MCEYFENFSVHTHAGHLGEGFYDNIWLTEADTQSLVMRAGFYEGMQESCGQLLGEPCATTTDCLNGLTCSDEVCPHGISAYHQHSLALQVPTSSQESKSLLHPVWLMQKLYKKCPISSNFFG